MLVEQDLFGNVRDKVKRAVEIAKCFCPDEGYYLAYSGGKDSTVVKAILDMAGVKYDTHYNVTTVDPPELVRFIISQFDAVVYEYSDDRPNKHFVVKNGHLRPGVIEHGNIIYFNIPQHTMRELIVKKQFPPTRLMRYCCEELKEVSGEGRVVVTGVRSAESRNRKQNQGMVTMPNKKTAKVAKENNANFFVNSAGGGGAELRRCSFTQDCRTVLQNTQDYGKSYHRLHRGRCLGVYQSIQPSVLQPL